MATTRAVAGAMKLVGGDPCLDFVNTVGGRIVAGPALPSVVRDDKLAAYPDLVAWAQDTGLMSEAHARGLSRVARGRPREAARVFARAAKLREALYRVLRSLMRRRRPEMADLDALNDELDVMRARERLVTGQSGLRWECAGAGRRLEAVLWPVCRAASTLLTSGDLSRLRQCAGEGCGWLFLDRSRNRSRQWCAMEDCGNVSKVRRFRQRRRRRTHLSHDADVGAR